MSFNLQQALQRALNVFGKERSDMRLRLQDYHDEKKEPPLELSIKYGVYCRILDKLGCLL